MFRGMVIASTSRKLGNEALNGLDFDFRFLNELGMFGN